MHVLLSVLRPRGPIALHPFWVVGFIWDSLAAYTALFLLTTVKNGSLPTAPSHNSNFFPLLLLYFYWPVYNEFIFDT